MEQSKKIGLFTCIAVVAGNMMGSGIALLPASLAKIGSIAIIGWIIAAIGALSLAYVFARLSTKNPQSGEVLPKMVMTPHKAFQLELKGKIQDCYLEQNQR